ncbi:hypothetical protein EMIT0111MI5_70174 [Burkholderia sp. IT-111MI5]
MSPTFGLRVEACIDTATDRPVQWFVDNLLPEEAMRMSLARDAKGDAWGPARILRARIGRRAHAARRRRAGSGGSTRRYPEFRVRGGLGLRFRC